MYMRMSVIQSVLFHKDLYDTYRARRGLLRHKIHPLKRVDITTNWLRYRIRNPDHDNFEYKLRL